jgi:hypothetical protein
VIWSERRRAETSRADLGGADAAVLCEVGKMDG